ncbi:MAG: hypothetical protein H6732_02765 [Alphaproteobacteria bacterium]|nr:hypothetical protein [Alphaproteobacteria bacterium]
MHRTGPRTLRRGDIRVEVAFVLVFVATIVTATWALPDALASLLEAEEAEVHAATRAAVPQVREAPPEVPDAVQAPEDLPWDAVDIWNPSGAVRTDGTALATRDTRDM